MGTRRIGIWHAWIEGNGGVDLDTFKPTKREALDALREAGVIVPADAATPAEIDLPDGRSVHLVHVEIEATKRGIAQALSLLPNR